MQEPSQIQSYIVEIIKSFNPHNIILSTIKDFNGVNNFLPDITSPILSADILDIISDAGKWWDIVLFTGNNDNGWGKGVKIRITRWNYDNELEMFFFHVYQENAVQEFCITKGVLASRACLIDNVRGGFTPIFVKVEKAIEILDSFLRNNVEIEEG